MPNDNWPNKIKSPHLYWDLNPRPLVYEVSALTITLTWQVIVTDVKISDPQSMLNHLAVGNEFCQFGKKCVMCFLNVWYEKVSQIYFLCKTSFFIVIFVNMHNVHISLQQS